MWQRPSESPTCALTGSFVAGQTYQGQAQILAPANVAATSSASNAATVTWSGSADTVGVTSYTITRNGTVISKVSGTTVTFTDVSTVSAHTYACLLYTSDAPD